MDGGGLDYGGGGEHGSVRPRIKNMKRAAVDYSSSMSMWVRNRRPLSLPKRGLETERPSPSYAIDVLPPSASRTKAVDAIPAKHLHSSLNKIRHPVNVVRWTPDGRRVLTGSTSGEFTLWNGISWNFETIMQAHDSAVRACAWSHSDDWLISAEQAGVVKYWQPNFNNVNSIQAHEEPVRDLTFSPTDTKFVTAADDACLKIFDFAQGAQETILKGHQWDAKCVDWHPTKGLLASGSKDHQIKLWDPRTGRCLTTLHGHKNTVSKTLFEPSRGWLLASCARDSTARVFDIRMMRDVFLLRGHEKDIATLIWHPFHANLLTTGGADGAMHHYLLDEQNAPAGTASTLSPYDTPAGIDTPAQTIYPAHKVSSAHEFAIWSMDWHPLGHILVSGSNDRATRFWSRPKPGDSTWVNDRWHIGQAAAEAQGTWRSTRAGEREQKEQEEDDEEADGLVDQAMPSKNGPGGLALPGLLPGLPGINASLPSLFPTAAAQQPPLPPPAQLPPGFNPAAFPQLPGMVPGMMPGMIPPVAGLGSVPPPPLPPGVDVEQLKAMFGGAFPPPPVPGQGASFPPLPPGMSLPPGFPAPPPGFAMPGGAGGLPGMMPMMGMPGMPTPPPGADAAGIRKRGPLPSQQESLKMEQRAGNYTKIR